MTMRMASERMRRRISAVMTPPPGPYSTMTRARFQSIGCSSSLMRNLELGTIEPSMRGWRKKLRANSRASPVRVRLGIGWFFDTLCSAWVMLIANSYIMRRFRLSVTVISTARPFGVVAELAQLCDQPVTVLALDLDDPVPNAASRATESLQAAGERLEVRGGKRQARDHGNALAAAAGHLAADAHAGGRDRPGVLIGAHGPTLNLVLCGGAELALYRVRNTRYAGPIHRIPHDRLRPGGDPGEAVLGDDQLGAAALSPAACERWLPPQAAVCLPGGAGGGRAGRDRQGLRVRQGPVCDVHARRVEGVGGGGQSQRGCRAVRAPRRSRPGVFREDLLSRTGSGWRQALHAVRHRAA